MTEMSMPALITFVVAVAAALLAWFVLDTGATTLAHYRAGFTQRARFQLREFFLHIDPARLFAANLAVMAVGAVLAWAISGSALVAIPVFAALALLPRLLYAALRRRRLRRFDEQLPDALMLLCGGLRAGVGFNSALQQLVAEAQPPLAQEFALMLREQRLGVTLEEGLVNLAQRVPTPSTTLVVSTMRIANETGGSLAETLERIAQTIRSRLQMEGKIGALTAQGKLQAWVVGMLPIALMLVLVTMEPEAMSLLWQSRMGWAALTLIGLLELLGVYLIRRIVAIDV